MKPRGLRAVAVALALAGLVAVSADSCVGAPSPSIPGCQATTTAPDWAAKNFSTDGTGLLVKKINPLLRVVQGTVWARCPVAVESHVIDVEIWARPQGSVRDLYLLNKGNFTNRPGMDWTPYTITAPFITGDYEIRYTVFVTNDDGPQPPESGKGYRASFTIDDWG